MKKAEMSVNLIVVIVIALLILVIIVFLLGRNFLGLQNSADCPSKGGFCMRDGEACPNNQISVDMVTSSGCGTGYFCCRQT